MKSILLTLALIATAVPALADQPLPPSPQERAKKKMDLLARCIEQLGPEQADKCAQIIYGPSPRR